ncbi:CDP-glycerol glycerophosphotransferase family protein [Niallia sp. JL1B1071]|uniref:CDP-glycerol glycerophosphotransferase family protein n=1 Tax=Niallia tiangongensis TaxID=3237105 RepID=UPI0037DDB89F
MIIENIHIDDGRKLLSFTVPQVKFGNISNIVFVERKNGFEWCPNEYLDYHLGRVSIELKEFINTYYNQISRWDLYLEIVEDNHIKRYRLRFSDKLDEKFNRYFQSITTLDVNVVTPYITINNGLSIVITQPNYLATEKSNLKFRISSFVMEKNRLYFKIKINCPKTKGNFLFQSFILKYRSKVENVEYSFPIKSNVLKGNTVILTIELDISNLKLEKYYWDFFLEIVYKEERFLARINNPSGRIKKGLGKIKSRQSYEYGDGNWVYPYLTLANTIALVYKEKELHETNNNQWKEKIAWIVSVLFKWYFNKKNIWLVFEKFSDGAQDNGYYFFKYSYENSKKKNLYYIIKQDSPDYSNLKAMNDKVIHYMSFKYMVYLFAAKLLISSEAKGHAYDIRALRGRLKDSLEQKRYVFLQHGVIALKRVDSIYKKNSRNAADLFVVSSEQEKEIIVNNFGYQKDEVIVTGLSRWDVLKDKSGKNNERNIMLMPTWRSWMDDIPEEKFIETEYYKNYTSLMSSNSLLEMMENNDLYLQFYIHPKFKEYIDRFESSNNRVKINQYGEIKVNELLMNSKILITDYSSVAWDMYFQKKPILFYQFDLENYLKYQGSYIDMDNELFGDRAFTLEELENSIQKYIMNNFQEEEKYAEMRKNLLSYTDNNNSKRIFDEIMKHKQVLNKRKKKKQSYRNSDFLRLCWDVAKKNAWTYKIALNIKNKLIGD